MNELSKEKKIEIEMHLFVISPFCLKCFSCHLKQKKSKSNF